MFHAGDMTSDEKDFPVPDFPDPSQTRHYETSHKYALAAEAAAESPDAEVQDRASRRLQVCTPEEVLAYIQCTLGFCPTDSLVIIAFAERQLSTVIRCDLPEVLRLMLQSDTLEGVTFLDFGLTDTQKLQLTELGEHLGQLIVREPSTTGCLLVYLPATVSVSDQHALAATGTVNAMITAQLGIEKVPVEESWLIHHNELWHLRCAVTTDCEVQGQDLGDPEATEIFRALDPQGRTRQQAQTAARKLVFPPAASVSSNPLPDTQSLLKQRPKAVLNWLQCWEDRLSSGPAMLHSDQVSELLSALEHPTLRDAVLGLACFDFTTAICGMVALDRFPPEIATTAGLQGNVQDGLSLEGCLYGQSDRSPDWQRIAALERLCRQLLPLADNHSGGSVAGMLVWIEWVRGRGSMALSYVQQARDNYPSERFLMALESVLNQGLVAEWATRTDSAWTPRHAA